MEKGLTTSDNINAHFINNYVCFGPLLYPWPCISEQHFPFEESAVVTGSYNSQSHTKAESSEGGMGKGEGRRVRKDWGFGDYRSSVPSPGRTDGRGRSWIRRIEIERKKLERGKRRSTLSLSLV